MVNKPASKNSEIEWTASEFIERHKSPGWYLVFIVTFLSSLALVFIITRDYITVVTLSIVGILFAILATRSPRQIIYQMSEHGIKIGQTNHSYTEFKSFGIAHDGAIGYINFMPLKRFMPEVSIHYPPEQEEKILGLLVDHLPHEELPERTIDKFAKKIHF